MAVRGPQETITSSLVLLLLLSVTQLCNSSGAHQHRLVVRLDPGSSVTHCATLENVLTEASEQLYNVSRGRLQWDRITFLLPRNYSADCAFMSQPRRVVRNRRADGHQADLIVGDSHPLLGDLPWAEQFYGGCGMAGRGVRLSRSFLASAHRQNNTLFLQGRQILREWIKNRYGVFDERGFQGDVQYPAETSLYGSHPPGSVPMESTTCSTFRNQSSSSSSSVAEHSVWLLEDGEELLDEGHINRTDYHGLGDEDNKEDEQHEHGEHQRQREPKSGRVKVTSIMAALDAEDFCSEENHIRWMPTKQNLLCNEKSIWQVMNEHPDFFPPPSSPQSAITSPEFWALDDNTTDLPSLEDTAVTYPVVTDSFSSFFPPEFEYILPATDRYVLVLDRSQTSAQPNRWSLVRRSLYRWVHALPNETYLSVIISGSQQQTQQQQPSQQSVALTWTKVTADNRDGILGRIPRRPASSAATPAQLASAIQLAHQLLNDEDESSCCGGQLILLTGSEESLPITAVIQQSNPSSDNDAGITVHTIVFPSQSAGEGLQSIPAGTTSGLQLAVPGLIEDENNQEEFTSSGLVQARLTSALLEVLRYSSDSGSAYIPAAPIQVYEENLTAGGSGQQTTTTGGTFTLDSPLGENVWIVAHCADEADLDTLQVLSPSGRLYDLPLVSDGMLHVRIPRTDEFGQWSYRLRFSPAQPSTSTSPILTATVEVTAQPIPAAEGLLESAEPAVTIKAWTNIGRTSVNASSQAVLLYARVTLGRLTPILDAKVTALVRPPGVNFTGPPFIVQLYDRGTGDPDVTRADGIYSGYFTQPVPEPGHYSVQILVTDDSLRASIPTSGKIDPEACCGSSVPYEGTRSIQPFRRIVSGPSFTTFAGPEPEEDIYPPGRITDLRVERISNGTSHEAELAWTSPGSNYDRGTASLYQIRCYTDRTALNDSLAILVHASLTPIPLPAGSLQRTAVAVPWPNQLFYYAVVALDEAGQSGMISNIVPVYIDEPPPPPTTAPPAGHGSDADGWLYGGNGVNVTLPIQHEGGLTEHQLYAVAGGVAGFVILLLILSVAACLSRRRRAGKPDKNSSSMHGIQVEPMKSALPDVSLVSNTKKPQQSGDSTDPQDRPVYKIYVNNAYIQEEDGELKIVTPDGRIIQRGSPWFSNNGGFSGHHTLPRGRSMTRLEGDELNVSASACTNGNVSGSGNPTDFLGLQHHWSLPRTKNSPHRAKVLTNGSIMQHSGSQGLLNLATNTSSSSANSSGPGSNDVNHNSGGHPGNMNHNGQQQCHSGDGTSISSKPSVSSEDTGIELGSDHLIGQAGSDSRDSSGDGLVGLLSSMDPLMAHLHLPILPPPGFGPASHNNNSGSSGYLPMYAGQQNNGGGSNLLPPLPPSPGSRDARVIRLPSYNQVDWMAISSRKPLMMMNGDGLGSLGSYDHQDELTNGRYGGGNGVATSTPQISPPPPSTPSGGSALSTAFERPPPVRRKKRHISFV